MNDWNDSTARIDRHRAMRAHVSLRTARQQKIDKIVERLNPKRALAILAFVGFVGGFAIAGVLQTSVSVAQEVVTLAAMEAQRRGTGTGANIDTPDLRRRDPVVWSAAPVISSELRSAELLRSSFGGPVLLAKKLGTLILW